MPPSEDLLTPQETAAVSGVPVRQVYKLARERLPKRFVVRRAGRVFYRSQAAVCARIDHDLPKDVPVSVRKMFYAQVERDPGAGTVEHHAGLLSYVVDAGAVRRAVTAELAAYRKAMETIVEDPEIQGGAASFKGTRILAHTVADLLRQGASAAELKEDYPNLTDAMLEAAVLYGRTHPRRGRPKTPTWRDGEPVATRRRKRAAVA
jgi:uncharacterized protein (DUF433 family)